MRRRSSRPRLAALLGLALQTGAGSGGGNDFTAIKTGEPAP